MKVAVTTPTGHIGGVVTDALLRAGADVVLLVRDPAKVKGFTARGAAAQAGSLEDAEFVRRATRATDCLFWVTPPSFGAADFRGYQNVLGRSAAAAVRANRIARVVLVSSLGAQHASGTGPILGLHDTEKLLTGAAPHVTCLRPGMFMENHLNSIEAVRQAKSVFLPIPGSWTTRFIATRDIGEMAAKRVLDTGWRGHEIRELHGPEELSFDGAAAALSEALGERVTHVQVTLEQTREALLGMGASPSVAAAYVELFEGAARGLLEPTQPPTPETTAKTTFARFAHEVLAPAVRGAAPAR
ncbi:MAG: NmrA family NAD(P)-binding protein [Candidatus Eiseniibacteriota bacterium]